MKALFSKIGDRMFIRNHTYVKNSRGQTLVEFALVLALLLAILFGITEFGRAWFYSNHLTNTVRSAARYAAVLSVPNAGKVTTYVQQELAGYMKVDDIVSPNGILITAAEPDGTTKPYSEVQRGDTIKVTVRYNFTVLAGSIIPYFNGNYIIERSASMRFEG